MKPEPVPELPSSEPKPVRRGLSNSPLARPERLIHLLADRVQDYLYFPMPDPLYLVLGTLAGNIMKGSPIWLVLIGAPSCQPAGSQVLMADGTWRDVEDVKTGDVVISPQKDGSSIQARVLQTTIIKDQPIYKVTASTKGNTKGYLCSGEHILPFMKTWQKYILGSGAGASKKNQPQKLFEMRAEDFVQMGKRFTSRAKAFTVKAVQFPKRSFKVHPYVLGAMLGDGGMTTLQPRFNSADPEMFQKLSGLGVRFGAREKRPGFVEWANVLQPYSGHLKRLPVYGCGSATKFVPFEYKHASIEQRLQLLAGLIDTDGTRSEFTSTSRALAEDVVWLVHSVGGHASIKKRIQEPSKLVKTSSIQYRVYFHFGEHIPQFTLKRKIRATRNKKLDVRHKRMKVELIGRDTVYGFTLASPSGWYITDDWLVTHNSGRTIMLETLANLKPESNKPGVHIVGAIKGPGSLLSATSTNERTKDATGGLLQHIGPRGIIVMKDFTSMLSMAREALGETIGALREVFDGRWSRPVGTDGGRCLEWRGRLGFLAACTPAIDRHSATIGDLGERWVYYRYPETDGYGETIKALGNKDPELMMNELRGHIENFIEAIGLEWNEERRDLDQYETNRLYAMASLICKARSGVSRDVYQGNEIADIAIAEAPPRMAQELGQLYLGLERIGLEQDAAWKLVGKVALDSVRQLRMVMVLTMYGSTKAMTPSDLRMTIKCGKKIVENTLDDLKVHGIVEPVFGPKKSRDPAEHEKYGSWRLTEWATRQLELGWKTDRREYELQQQQEQEQG